MPRSHESQKDALEEQTKININRPKTQNKEIRRKRND